MVNYMKAICRSDLTFGERLVLLYLVHPEYKDGSLLYHSELLHMSVRTVVKAIDGLVERGYVERIKRETKGMKSYNLHRLLPKTEELFK